MRGAINRFVQLVVDPLNDVSLFAYPRVWKNRVSRSKIFQVCLEGTDVNRRPVRNVLRKPERGRDFLH